MLEEHIGDMIPDTQLWEIVTEYVSKSIRGNNGNKQAPKRVAQGRRTHGRLRMTWRRYMDEELENVKRPEKRQKN